MVQAQSNLDKANTALQDLYNPTSDTVSAAQQAVLSAQSQLTKAQQARSALDTNWSDSKSAAQTAVDNDAKMTTCLQPKPSWRARRRPARHLPLGKLRADFLVRAQRPERHRCKRSVLGLRYGDAGGVHAVRCVRDR